MTCVYPNKKELLAHVGRAEQVASIRRATLEDGKGRGMRVVDVTTGGGLAFTVYPDRGLDIGPATFEGVPFVWTTCNGPVAPAFYDGTGFEWLRTWCGGLLTTAGLLNVGGPFTGEDGVHGLHGRQDALPAEQVNTRAEWIDAEHYLLEVTAKIVHARVFGENLVSTRTIRSYLGAKTVEIEDVTENCGDQATPYMRLYHMNFGWPLVSEDCELVAPDHVVTPQRDYGAAAADWMHFGRPVAGQAEQVYYHDQAADAEGWATMAIVNPKAGFQMKLSYTKAELPYLVQWKMPGQGLYVMGLEPANCLPEGRPANAEKGILRTLQPGESVTTKVRVELSTL